jgi:hypothetical protein
MRLYDLNDFLRLSATLNYQLSAAPVSTDALLYTITGDRPLSEDHRRVLLDVLTYLDQAYGQKRRRLGPMAVLHPLRATALLAAAADKLHLLDLLSILLHDKFEDVGPEDQKPEEWQVLEERFHALLKRIDPTDEWYLMERLELLTRRGEQESYYAYIGRLVDRAASTPELVRVKLVDRLDNTLDMRIDFQDPLDEADFFAHLFRVLFVPGYAGYQPERSHPPTAPLNGARRLYELFKTVVTLSLVRQMGSIAPTDLVALRLFEALCIASMNEAQRIVMHISGYHLRDTAKQRSLLLETMDYCQRGGVRSITAPGAPHRLDGLFLAQFDHRDRKSLHAKLDALYQDKELMIEAALAFIVIFTSFLSDPAFYLRGVTAAGIHVEAAA